MKKEKKGAHKKKISSSNSFQISSIIKQYIFYAVLIISIFLIFYFNQLTSKENVVEYNTPEIKRYLEWSNFYSVDQKYLDLTFAEFYWPNIDQDKQIVFEEDDVIVSNNIIENSSYRTLSFKSDDGGIHGMIKCEDNECKKYETLRIMMFYIETQIIAMSFSPKDDCKVKSESLVIGLGSGSTPIWMQEVYPLMEIDVVEISQAVVNGAKQKMGFKEGRNTKVHVADGFDWVESLPPNKKYDFIFLDAYMDRKIPSNFVSHYFLSKLRSHLSKDGILITNFCILEYEVQEMYNILSDYFRVFDSVRMMESTKHNKILVSWNGKNQVYETDEDIYKRRISLEKSCPHTPLRRGIGYSFDMKRDIKDPVRTVWTLVAFHHDFAVMHQCIENKLPATDCYFMESLPNYIPISHQIKRY